MFVANASSPTTPYLSVATASHLRAGAQQVRESTDNAPGDDAGWQSAARHFTKAAQSLSDSRQAAFLCGEVEAFTPRVGRLGLALPQPMAAASTCDDGATAGSPLARIRQRAVIQQHCCQVGPSEVGLRGLGARESALLADAHVRQQTFGGWQVTEASSIGHRPCMQDLAGAFRHASWTVAGVLDGHGSAQFGSAFVRSAWRHLQAAFVDFFPAAGAATEPQQIRQRLKDMFATGVGADHNEGDASPAAASLDARLRRAYAEDCGGSTATVLCLSRDAFYVANLGDSRAVMVGADGSAQRLTVDHKPHGLEADKVRARGDYVMRDRDGRVSRVGGMLAVSRALGDWDTLGVGHRPQISGGQVAEAQAFVLGSDGFFDVVRDEDAARYIHTAMAHRQDPRRICAELLAHALACRSRDNITVMLVVPDKAPSL